MDEIVILKCDAPTFVSPRITARRDDSIDAIVVTVTSAWETSVYIRDDMNLRVQCDLMFADVCYEHMRHDEIAHIVDVTYDTLLSMRDDAHVVDPDNAHA